MADDENIFMAKLAEQAERYDEMVKYMKQYVMINPNLGLEERNLLSVAYKNVVGARRASLRVIGSIEQKEQQKNSDKLTDITTYKVKVEDELDKICDDILALLDEKLIPSAEASSAAESIVFYQKVHPRPDCSRATAASTARFTLLLPPPPH